MAVPEFLMWLWPTGLSMVMCGAVRAQCGARQPDCPLYFITKDLGVEEDECVKKGLICSSDKFISTVEDVDFLRGNFPDVMAVDMESGAIAQTCYLNNVPFAAIRVVSDTPGAGDNIAQYSDFWSDAPKATFRVVRKVLESAENL